MSRSQNSCSVQDSGKIQRASKQNCFCSRSSPSSTSRATLSSPQLTTAAIRAISLPSPLRDHKARPRPSSSSYSQSPSTRPRSSASSTRPCSPHQASLRLSVQRGLVVLSRRTRPRSPAMNSSSKVTLVSVNLPSALPTAHATHQSSLRTPFNRMHSSTLSAFSVPLTNTASLFSRACVYQIAARASKTSGYSPPQTLIQIR